MRVLVACEESGRVTAEFRRLGHEAYSCDILPTSGEHPEWHIQGDVLPLLKEKWDMIIAFPPCTYLTVTGNRWFLQRYGKKAKERLKARERAVAFFMSFANADCPRIAIENPVGYMSTYWKKPTQIVEPYYFGDKARKKTCLWLKGLPRLQKTKIVSCGEILDGGYSVGASANYATKAGKVLAWNDPETARIRSKTFPGLARAMAEQWGGGEVYGQLGLWAVDDGQ